MKAAIYTLGCKVNQYESQVIAQALKNEGYELVAPDKFADVYIVNSCTVTSESDRKNRQIVRRLRRQNPDAAVLLTGCMPQAYPKESAALLEADIIVGNRRNHEIPQLLQTFFQTRQRHVATLEHKKDDPFIPCAVHSFYGRTRAEIKIEDGCNRFCAYCAIPYARGRVRSKKIEDIRTESAALGDAGYSEIVLVGINLSAYADENNDICDAVAAACESDKVLRVRLGSLEPDHLTDDVIERLARCPKLCPQFHISLQSGCDRTLKRMNRHYTADEYKALCDKLRRTFPDTTLTTDVMVGFPGESPEDFEASLAFVRGIGFEKVHVFPYSPRSGTRAAEMDGQVPKAVKEQRAAVMIAETEAIRQSFLRAQVGKTVQVLIEEHKENGWHEGYTANYTPVRVQGNCPEQGLVTVRITDADADKCIAVAL